MCVCKEAVVSALGLLQYFQLPAKNYIYVYMCVCKETVVSALKLLQYFQLPEKILVLF